jgi:vacuolar-type H+-ATPase subunit D/Vma8
MILHFCDRIISICPAAYFVDELFDASTCLIARFNNAIISTLEHNTMSEERLERIEAQIAELRELMMQQHLSTKQDVNVMQQKIDTMREEITLLRQRSNSIESTIIVAMHEGFNSLRNYLDDWSYDIADNERKQRRLNRRSERLEREEDED